MTVIGIGLGLVVHMRLRLVVPSDEKLVEIALQRWGCLVRVFGNRRRWCERTIFTIGRSMITIVMLAVGQGYGRYDEVSPFPKVGGLRTTRPRVFRGLFLKPESLP